MTGAAAALLAIAFPAIDPVALQIGPVAIRWYALAYLAGFLIGWRYALHLAGIGTARPSRRELDEFLTWAVLGVILGGRLGYVLFYNLEAYADRPWDALKIWEGGMAFHGGLIGMIAAMILFAWRRGFSPFAIGDIVAAAGPIGLFFGRLANFVNGELWGRESGLPWAMQFPGAEGGPRHPSQIYEAILEGLVLFAVLAVLAHRPAVRRRPGIVGGVFLILYGLFRFLVEFVREPDAQLVGFAQSTGLHMGQWLSLPMIILGAWLMWTAKSRRQRVEPIAGTESVA